MVGYLSYIVAEDREPIALSRTTREKFLTELVFAIKVEGRSFTEAQLTEYAEAFARKFDFNVSPSRFVAAFIEKCILHLEGDQIRFTLPFMEAYLLAKRLAENANEAVKYFSISSRQFDHRTFTIYAEMGACGLIIAKLVDELKLAIEKMSSDPAAKPILLDMTIAPALLESPNRLHSIQNRLRQAEDDVRSDRDQSKEKQRFLDVSDRVRENTATRASAVRSIEGVTEGGASNVVDESTAIWAIAVSLLGSGAERLEAEVKRDLVKKIVKLAALIVDRWTRAHRAVDFTSLRKEVLENEVLVATIARSKSKTDMTYARNIMRSIADLLEYIYMLQPFIGIVTHLCEEARDDVLPESIVNTLVEGGVEELIKNLWLSDINVSKGKKRLVDSIKSLPKSKFLRNAIATQLMARVYWKHWRKDDRLSLLDAANESLKGVGQQHKTSELQRIVEKLPDTEDPSL